MSSITSEQLKIAAVDADPARIAAEVAKFEADPEGYIQQNHTRLTNYDFPVYAATNLKISTKLGELIPLRFNRMQRYLWGLLLEDLAAGRPVRWFILKGRQLGTSSWVLGLFYWLTSTQSNRQALIVAHDDDATQNFNGKVRYNYHANSHGLLKPDTTLSNRDKVHFGVKATAGNASKGPGLNSAISFETANKPSLGRSFTLQYILLSEFALWESYGIDCDEVLPGLYQAQPKRGGTILIKESTAKGVGQAHNFWHDPTNNYRKIFISWLAEDEYRKPLRDDEEFELCDSEEDGGYATKYGNEIEEAELIRKELLQWYPEEAANEEWLHAEVLARLNWRRDKINTDFRGDKTLFRNEYPTIPAHAWAAQSRQCFDGGSIAAMRAHVHEEGLTPYRCNYIHDVEETNPNRKFKVEPYGKVLFYHLPEEGETYVIGGDPSMGFAETSDPSALIVLKTPNLEEVASFNAIMPPEEFAEMAFYMGRLYNNALLGVEHNERGGAVANSILSKTLHYPRLYYARDQYTNKRAKIPGFVTTAVNKSKMVADLAQMIRDHAVLFRSPGLIDPVKGQLIHYEEKKDGSLGGAQGWKDDFVSAALIAVCLASKVHQYPQQSPGIPPGSFAEAAEMIRQRNRKLGRLRR
jgi:hypothetical protein